jgi:hypothetical protein
VRPPDLQGPMGRAWKLAIQTQHVDQMATLSFWLIDAPHSHPFWPWHVLALVHLRDIEGQSKPAHKRYPEAEYELLILAIDPEVCPPDPDDYDGGFTLSPPDVMEQFDVKGSDHDAIRIVEASVRAIVNGHISPDQDYRSTWAGMLKATADHFKSGAHVES